MATSAFKFDMGVTLRDTITGVQGTVTGRSEFINGCRQYCLEYAKDDERKRVWEDEGRLEKVEAPVKTVAKSPDPGGPQSTPPRSRAHGK